MTEEHLTLTIDFTIGDTEHDDSFELGGTIGEKGASEVIENWLRSQLSAGADPTEPNRLKTYHVEIDWYPSNDRLSCRSNCGNKSLRDGLLIYVLKRLTGKE